MNNTAFSVTSGPLVLNPTKVPKGGRTLELLSEVFRAAWQADHPSREGHRFLA